MKNINLLVLLGAAITAVILFAKKQTESDENTEFFLVDGFKSFLGLKNVPKGVGNNNPGNLRITNSTWKGKIPVSQNTDGQFEQFKQYRYGIRALRVLLLKYQKDGRNTITKIINRYAPQTENPTESYIDFVEKRTQFGRNKTLVFSESQLDKLVEAITTFENGALVVTTEDLEQARAIT